MDMPIFQNGPIIFFPFELAHFGIQDKFGHLLAENAKMTELKKRCFLGRIVLTHAERHV